MSGMFDAVETILASIPAMTRNQIILESAKDPSFIKKEIEPLLYQPNAAKRIDDRMKKVVANVLSPHKHGEMAGRWPVLRREFKGLVEKAKVVKAGMYGLGDEEYAGYDQPEAPAAEPSTWDIILKGLEIGITGGAKIYDSYAERQAAEAKAEADAAIAALRLTTTGATGTTGSTRPSTATSGGSSGGATDGGVPSWVIYAALATVVVGGGVYVLTRK